MVHDQRPKHVAERDAHSRSLPGSASGPHKAGARAPTGHGALATELAAIADARRELAQARSEGDEIPLHNDSADIPPTSSLGQTKAGELGFGLPSGAEQGYTDPSQEERESLQRERNEAFHHHTTADSRGGGATLADLARTSKASGASHPLGNPDGPEFTSTAGMRADVLLDQVGRSVGTESGTGAAGIGEVEIGRDASTANTAPIK
ncbi:hypothetical protein CF327_g2100 [Tilletia walkeri]|nr:hypothetical protein CF327_g2100 [Tilletia walkeri]